MLIVFEDYQRFDENQRKSVDHQAFYLKKKGGVGAEVTTILNQSKQKAKPKIKLKDWYETEICN